VTSISYELAKKTMERMAADGQLRGDRGTYRTLSPRVPLSPDEPLPGTEGREGHGVRGSNVPTFLFAAGEEGDDR
jgi:hypothetical protein